MRERNGLLLAAGYAPLYRERELDTPEMESVRQALDRFLRAHEPYPAVVIDRRHDLLAANDALHLLTDGVDPELMRPPANALRVALHPDGMTPRTVNLVSGARASCSACDGRSRPPATPRSSNYTKSSRAIRGARSRPTRAESAAAEIVLPLRLRDDDGELAFFSPLSTFGTAVDITLAELSIEAFYPASAATALRLLKDIDGPRR